MKGENKRGREKIAKFSLQNDHQNNADNSGNFGNRVNVHIWV